MIRPKFIVIGDIGGTNCRLELLRCEHEALSSRGGVRPNSQCTARYQTNSAASVLELLQRFSFESDYKAAQQNGDIVLCSLSVCGPVTDGIAILSAQTFGEGGWVVNSSELSTSLGYHVNLINDFHAVGISLTLIPNESIVTLYNGDGRTPRPHDVRAWLGPGTGLGEGYAVWIPSNEKYESGHVGDGDWAICSSEGGMSDFVPRTEEEWSLRQYISCQGPTQTPFGFVDVEHVVSGTGVVNIYKWLRQTHTERVCDSLLDAQIMSSPSDAARLICENASSAAAADGSDTPVACPVDPLCSRAMEMFLDALGAEASNMALRYQALGGVYIAGGITCKIIEIIRSGRVTRAYLGKEHSLPVYRSCPLYVVNIPGDELGLTGAYLHALKCLRKIHHEQN